MFTICKDIKLQRTSMPRLHHKLKSTPTNFKVSSLTSKLLNVICKQVSSHMSEDELQQFHSNAPEEKEKLNKILALEKFLMVKSQKKMLALQIRQQK